MTTQPSRLRTSTTSADEAVAGRDWIMLLLPFCVPQSVFRRSRRRYGTDFDSQLRQGKLGYTHGRPGGVVAWQVLILDFGELLHLSAQIEMKTRQLDNIFQARAGRGQGSLQALEARRACAAIPLAGERVSSIP